MGYHEPGPRHAHRHAGGRAAHDSQPAAPRRGVARELLIELIEHRVNGLERLADQHERQRVIHAEARMTLRGADRKAGDPGPQGGGAAFGPAFVGGPQYQGGGRIFIAGEADDKLLPQEIELLGEDQILYSSDLPHGEGRHNAAKEIIARKDINERQKQKILYDNAVKFFGEP